MEDITLAVQARVGWEFGGRIPKEYTLSLAAQTNATPLPAVPEVFGIRLPPASEALTSIDFDLVPNKPPPGTKLYDEEVEEIEESESEEDEDEDMEPATIPGPAPAREQITVAGLGSVSAIQTPSDIDVFGTPAQAADEGSDAAEEEDGLFAGGDVEEEEEESGAEDHALGDSRTTINGMAGVKRKLVEEENYD